jgi:GxxExxY protein
MTEEEINAIAFRIIGAAIKVHDRIGPGCLESAYAPCLALEFVKAGLSFRREVSLTLRYDELVIPRAYVADFKVEEIIVVELKAESTLTDRDKRQLQTYLELDGAPLGLLLNFGAQLLTSPAGLSRVVNNFPHGTDGRK